MKKKLNLRKETVAMLDGMNEVRGGGTVLVSYQSNCNLCPSAVATQCNTGCTACPSKGDTCWNRTIGCVELTKETQVMLLCQSNATCEANPCRITNGDTEPCFPQTFPCA